MSDDMADLIKKVGSILNNNANSALNKNKVNTNPDTSNTNASYNGSDTSTLNNSIPDNLQDILRSVISNSSIKNNGCLANNSDKPSSSIDNEASSCTSNNEANTFDFSSIDISTILKIQKVVQSMNSEQSNSRANLLRSLKPYLKPSRQEKVEQYIQLFNMEKVIELLNTNGGGKK